MHRELVLCSGRFIPARRAPFFPSGLHSTGEHRRLVLARKRTPIAQMSEGDTETQRTRCAIEHCCGENAVLAQDSPGQGHILGPARWTGGHLTLPTTHFIPSARRTVQSFGKDFCSVTSHQFIDTLDCDK